MKIAKIRCVVAIEEFFMTTQHMFQATSGMVSPAGKNLSNSN